ncbi:MAG: vitamin epoxide reductase [Parcubacteria group bacterium]|nr:vitamin epoxide reductase [Parcubacteria group bacterium]
MRRPTLLTLTMLFSFAGIADSWYLAEHALTNTALSCGIGSLTGCNVVAQSAYSHFFGIPLGVYGLVFYALVFVLSALATTINVRRLMQTLFGLGIVGLLFSIYFAYLQFFVIDAVCIYCMGSFVLSILIFILTTVLVRIKQPSPPVVM